MWLLNHMQELLVVLAGMAVLAGGCLMVFADTAKRRLLPGHGDNAREIRRQPWLELGLGVIFTLAGVYFASRIFAGAWRGVVSALVGWLITVLTSWGAFTRFRPLVKAVFADETAGKPVLRLHRLFCIGLWLALAGMLGMLVILGLGVGA